MHKRYTYIKALLWTGIETYLDGECFSFEQSWRVSVSVVRVENLSVNNCAAKSLKLNYKGDKINIRMFVMLIGGFRLYGQTDLRRIA